MLDQLPFSSAILTAPPSAQGNASPSDRLQIPKAHLSVIRGLFLRTILLGSLGELPQVPTASHAEVLTFAETRQLMGRGLGWIDMHLLASAMLAKLPFWTVDKRLATVARELGLGVHNC